MHVQASNTESHAHSFLAPIYLFGAIDYPCAQLNTNQSVGFPRSGETLVILYFHSDSSLIAAATIARSNNACSMLDGRLLRRHTWGEQAIRPAPVADAVKPVPVFGMNKIFRPSPSKGIPDVSNLPHPHRIA